MTDLPIHYCPDCACSPCVCRLLPLFSSLEEDAEPCASGQHQYITRRRGGDPAEASSTELVTYCQICGAEPAEED